MRRDVFQAIADPTRREILALIANKSMNLNEVAENFNISRPAISRHVKMLEECGLVHIAQKGRERYCYAHLESLGEVTEWVEKHRKIWVARLNSLESYLDKIQSPSNMSERNNHD